MEARGASIALRFFCYALDDIARSLSEWVNRASGFDSSVNVYFS